MGYLMGIDLGTSSVKALIVDEGGKTMGMGQSGYEVLTPRMGYAEQEPEVWWECTKQAVAGALGSSRVAAEDISGIGFSGQMHGLVALDREKHTIGRAIIHLDQRSGMEREEICQKAGGLLQEELLNRPGAGMLICSLLWIRQHQPEVYEKIACVMSPKDYIRYKLTGVVCTDYSDASATLAFSVRNRRWCSELLQRLELREDIWPEVVESSAVVQTVTSQAAAETGLAKGTRVVAGAGDCAAQLIGNGIVEEGILSCNIGTASQLAAVTRRPVVDAGMCCQLWCHSLADTWIFQGGALNGGNTLSWLKNKVLRDKRPFSELDEEAYRVPAGCEGLIFLPFLAGERTPYNDPCARGVYFGLGLKQEQPYLVRAVMEGVMYNLCECRSVFQETGILQNRLISSGGGAKGRTWRQIQADMLDMPVYTTQTEEEACLGAAILAAVGTGVYEDVPSACREIVKLDPEVTEPVRENVARYQEYQSVYRDLYHQIKDLYPRLNS